MTMFPLERRDDHGVVHMARIFQGQYWTPACGQTEWQPGDSVTTLFVEGERSQPSEGIVTCLTCIASRFYANRG